MRNLNIIAIACALVFLASCTDIDRINANDPDGVAYSPDLASNSSSSVGVVYSSSSGVAVPSSSSRMVSSSGGGAVSSSSSRAVSSSSASAGVRCRIDLGAMGKICHPDLVNDNCQALRDEGYLATVDPTCGGI